MHELPKELGNSLRSFRNSVHRHNAEPDIEKAVDGEGAKRPHRTSSSLILVRMSYCRGPAQQGLNRH